MAQISIIKKSDIIKAGRFDAEYFKPKYLKESNLLERKGFFILNEIANAKGGKRLPLGESFSKKGIPYIRAEDVKNSFVDYENVPRISIQLHKKLINYQAKKNDILLTIVGNSVGDIGMVKFDLNNCNLTENASKITNLKNINPETLFIYMLSKYGQNQIHREKVGTAQPKLSLERIRKFKIPRYSDNFQSKIETIVKEAYQKQTKSKQLYKEAEQLLLTELDLVDYQPQHQLTFSTTKDEAQQAQRFDAEYFQPKYFDIIEKIENYSGGFDVIKNIVDWKKGIEVGTDAYTKTGKDFVRVSDISINGIETSNRKILTTLFTEIKGTFQPKKGEILFTKDGTIGVSYLLKDNVDGIISSAFLRLTLQNNYQGFEKESLVLMLNSIICKLQIEQLSGGAIIAHLKPSDFEKFKIPLIKQSIQSKIAEKITKSHQLRKESKELLELAKTKVEQEIERT